ncbi:FKBP12-associated protein, partial [Rhizophlyctis rosea]
MAFSCGVHFCEKRCHDLEGHGRRCRFDPEVVGRCPCGDKSVEELTDGRGRTKCTDAVPTCGAVCRKVLDCGHRCRDKCHLGGCPPCEEVIKSLCRCGREEVEVHCTELPRNEIGEVEQPRCGKVCQKMRHCKRHRCGERCCVTEFHLCEQSCGKTLGCGKHTCTFPCGHQGRCHDCVVGVSFDELLCNCGRTTMYPPIPCGVEAPICSFPCIRRPACGHPHLSEHNCHPDSEACPPCVVFVERPCACGKKVMKNIPCSRQGSPSCGEVCGKTLPSCGHKCAVFCHAGPCEDAGRCSAKCGRIRGMCGHVCGFGCHGTGFCMEDRPCQALVARSCRCGNKVLQGVCGAWKESVGKSAGMLQCDESCAVAERNRKLAEALEIDVSGGTSGGTGGGVEYEDPLLRFANSQAVFTKNVEKVLREFVEDSGKRLHHFPQAKVGANQFIVGLAPHYGLVADVVDVERGKGSVI